MSSEMIERNVKRDGREECGERQERGMSREIVERNVKRDSREECQERQ